LKPPVFEAATFFRATFYRDPEYSLKGASSGEEKGKEKSKEKVLRFMTQNPVITAQELSETLGLGTAGVDKIIRSLKIQKKLRRVGPDKGGRWEVFG